MIRKSLYLTALVLAGSFGSGCGSAGKSVADKSNAVEQKSKPLVQNEKTGDKLPEARAIAKQPSVPSTTGLAETSKPAELDRALAELTVPPAWLAEVQPQYDTSKPWKEARLEIRRLLGRNNENDRKAAIKLTWLYLQKDDIGNGHEYPMYLFLGNEPVWAVRAYEEWLKKPHSPVPLFGYKALAGLYMTYGKFDKSKALLDHAFKNLPGPPWRTMREAELHDAYGDLYAAWGKLGLAKQHYSQAVTIYPTAKPPYGGHLLAKRAATTQSKLDLLAYRSLKNVTLRDGTYNASTLGYSGDVHVTVTIRNGRIDAVSVKHQEKIEQNATTIIPRRIVEKQSLEVDGISGATVTKDAIVTGTYQAIKDAGLK